MSEATSQKDESFLTGGLRQSESPLPTPPSPQQKVSQIQVSKQEAKTPKQCAEMSACQSTELCARPNNQCEPQCPRAFPYNGHSRPGTQMPNRLSKTSMRADTGAAKLQRNFSPAAARQRLTHFQTLRAAPKYQGDQGALTARNFPPES